MEHKITGLKIQKKNPNRVNVFLDGEFAFGLSRILAAWLEVGQFINQEKINSLLSQDEIEVAYQLALNYISYQPRSKLEVTRRLEKNSFSELTIHTTIDKLEKNNLLDDYQYAKDWIENRNTFRPRSCRALKFELNKKGIPPETITELLDDVDETKLAYQAAVKQSKKYSTDDWDAFRRKLFGFLSRRGFNYEISANTVKKVWNEFQPLNSHMEERENL
jgi:regulatory protein